MSRSPFLRGAGPPSTGDPFWDSFISERFFDTHFGETLREEDFFPSYFTRRRTFGAPRSPLMVPHSPHAPTGSSANPLAAVAQAQQAFQQQAGQTATSGAVVPQNDIYQIMVDVAHFTPEEISVKMVDNTIVVTGKHEDKADNYGYVSRQFSRKYLLPSDVEPESVNSTLSADGVLAITAKRKPLLIKDSDEGRPVPIAISNQMISPGASGLAAPQFPQAAPTPAPSSTNIPVQNEPSAGAPAQ